MYFQSSLYEEDELGVQLRKKDEEITQLREDIGIKLQQLHVCLQVLLFSVPFPHLTCLSLSLSLSLSLESMQRRV